jgi:hypothetical protein
VYGEIAADCISGPRGASIVRAQYRDGPVHGQLHEVPDPPPNTVRVEVFTELVEHTAQPIPPGGEFPGMESKGYGYRFTNKIVTSVGNDPGGQTLTADYLYDAALDPDLAQHTISLESTE